MRTHINKILTILAIGILLAACETDIDFKGDETTSLMVVNSIITPDSVIKVQITKSNFFLSNKTNFDNIDNATVSIYVNNVLQERLLNMGEGIYIGTYIPKLNDVIKITAKNDILGEVYSTVSIQNPTSIISIDTISKNIETYPSLSNGKDMNDVDTFGISYNRDLHLKIKFQDDSKIKNYYRIVLKEKKYYDDSTSIEMNTFFSSDDLVFGEVSENDIFDSGSSYNSSFEFSDELFEGKIYELSLYKNYHNFIYKNNPKSEFDDENSKVIKNELIVELQSISESYYYYIKTKSADNSNGLNLFSEPVQIYSNISGGIGIFGSYSKSTYILNIPVYYQGDYDYYYGFQPGVFFERH